MPKARQILLLLLCVMLLCGTSCNRKLIPCPKIGGKNKRTEMLGPGGQKMQGVKVQMGKNGLVKKRRIF